MSIRKTIITTVVALTMVAIVAPGVAQGLTIEDLMAQIAQLQAQLVTLQGQAQAGTTTGVLPANCVGITFNRNLARSMTGSDVKCLQTLLNQLNVNVADSGAGSPGNETSFFGGATRAAVIRFQELYRSEILTPVGLTVGTGFVGASTRAKLNLLLSGWTTTTPPVTPTAGCPSGAVYNSITGALCPVTPTTPVVPTGAGLTVALAANNPAAGTIVRTQALAQLAKFTFVNGDNAEVKITGLKLKRTGISADASLSNVYLFDGAIRLTDGAAVSSTVINFNNTSGLFTVPAGGSKTISILSDMAGLAGETAGVSIIASTDVVTNASSVKGIFPLAGNLMTLATGTLAGAEFNATTTPAASSVDPQDDYTLWQNSVTITTRAVDMTRISFRKTGSVKNADLQNFRLYVDGVQVGSAVQSLDANGYVTFDLTSAPKRMEAGSRVIKLLGNIIGGSSLTFTFNLWNSADVTIIDSQYNANVLPDLAADAAFSKRSTGEQTVNSGVITITKMTDSPSGNIVNGASNATLAKFQVKAAGEAIKIETLYVSAVVSTGTVSYLRNGMLLANGVQIGSTSNLYDDGYTTAYTTFSLGSSLIVEPGTPVTLEVRADIYDNDGDNGVTTNTTISARIEGSSSWNNAEGRVSAATIDVPAADVSGNTLTVKQGTLTLSQYPAYTAQTVVAPLTGYKLAAFTLTAATTESVNMTAINVVLDDVSSYMSNLYVRYGDKTTTTKPTVSTTNSWSINNNLPAGTTINVEVYADVSSSMTGGDGVATLDVDGTTVSSAVNADSSAVDGQTINFGTAAFATAFAGTPQNQVVSGNQTVEAGRFKFTSSYQDYTIQELKIDPDVASGASATAENIISSAVLKDGSTVLATVPVTIVSANAYYYFTGLDVKVNANTTKTLTVDWVLATPSATAGTSGLRIIPALVYTKYMDPSGTVLEPTTERDGNSMWVYRSVPTLSSTDLSNSATISMNSVMDLYKFKVTAPSLADVSVKQFKIALGWSDAGTVDDMELEQLLLLEDGTDITTSVSIVDEDQGISAKAGNGVTEGNAYIIVTWLTDTETQISAGTSKTYTLRGTPQGFRMTAGTEATDSVSLQLAMDTATKTAGYDYLTTATAPTSVLRLGDAAASATNENAVFIWSDNSAVAHTAAISGATATNDWINGYLVKDTLVTETWSK